MNTYKRHRFPPDITSYAVWLYYRFYLSHRDIEDLLRAYRKMREIRDFELRIHDENTSGEIPGFIHLYAGEEAIAVGVCENLTDADYTSAATPGQ